MEQAPVKAKSHGSILQASVFTGGAQVVTSLASLVRGKFAAVFLGVAGVGVGGLLMQASGLIQSFVGLGLGSSGVRSIAAASTKGDVAALGRAYAVLRAWSWGTGLAAAALCILFSGPLSRATFDSDQHAVDFIFIGFAAFFQQLSQGQSALLRGLRRIKELAFLNVAAALVGLGLTLPCYIIWGLSGLAPAIMLSALVNLTCSWWYAKRVTLPHVTMGVAEIYQEGRSLVYVGMAFVGTAVAGMAANYITGRMIRVEIGLEGNGFYQAASGLTIVMVGFVLSAMGQDYYPRLTAVIHKKDEAATLIRDQTETAVLMGAPILVTVSTLAPLWLKLAFTEHFLTAAPVVTWLALGCLLRIVSWPLGYALLAEGRPSAILLYEGSFSALSIALAYLGIQYAGLEGAAGAFALLYAAYWLTMSCLIHAKVGYAPSRLALMLIAGSSAVIVAGRWMSMPVGAAVSAVITILCTRILLGHLDPTHRIYVMAAKLGPLGRVLGVRSSAHPET